MRAGSKPPPPEQAELASRSPCGPLRPREPAAPQWTSLTPAHPPPGQQLEPSPPTKSADPALAPTPVLVHSCQRREDVQPGPTHCLPLAVLVASKTRNSASRSAGILRAAHTQRKSYGASSALPHTDSDGPLRGGSQRWALSLGLIICLIQLQTPTQASSEAEFHVFAISIWVSPGKRSSSLAPTESRQDPPTHLSTHPRIYSCIHPLIHPLIRLSVWEGRPSSNASSKPGPVLALRTQKGVGPTHCPEPSLRDMLTFTVAA